MSDYWFQKLRAESSRFEILDFSPVVWLDSSDSDSVILNGSDVSQWTDKTGRGNNPVQGVASSQPAYTNTLNGLNVITFDGSEHLKTGVFSELVGKNYSFFIVARASGDPQTFISGKKTDFSDRLICQTQSLGRLRFVHYVDEVESQLSSFGGYPVLNEYALLECVLDKDSNVQKIITNGVEQGSKTIPADKYNEPLENLFIGTIFTLTQFLTGDIAEIVMFDKILPESSSIAIRDQLRSKWGSSGW